MYIHRGKGENEEKIAINGGQKRKKVVVFSSMQDKAPLFGSGESLWKIFRLKKPMAFFLRSSPILRFCTALKGH